MADLERSVEATREPSFLLAKPEKRLLRWIAARLPRWILPDDLTALGVSAALGIAVAYQLSNDSLDWLWVASALLVVQWFGDSLDGTLARVRGIERPTYGYYLDHLVDAIATAAIGIGLGLSPLMLLSIGTLIVVAYLILSINVYLESFAFNRFSIGYGYVGPTEIRLILIALNTVVVARRRARLRRRRPAADRLRPDRARDRDHHDRAPGRPRGAQPARARPQGAPGVQDRRGGAQQSQAAAVEAAESLRFPADCGNVKGGPLAIPGARS